MKLLNILFFFPRLVSFHRLPRWNFFRKGPDRRNGSSETLFNISNITYIFLYTISKKVRNCHRFFLRAHRM